MAIIAYMLHLRQVVQCVSGVRSRLDTSLRCKVDGIVLEAWLSWLREKGERLVSEDASSLD